MYKSASLPFAFLIAIQVLDVMVHVAADQMEPIRITSNLVIIVGAVGAYLSGRLNVLLSVLSGITYLVLNAVFIAQAGLANPQTGALRLPLFVFMAASLAVLIWLSRRAIWNRSLEN